MTTELSSNIQPTSLRIHTFPGSPQEQWVRERKRRFPANRPPNVEPGARFPSLHSLPLLKLFINMFTFTTCQNFPCSLQGTAGSVLNVGQQEQVYRPLHTTLAPQRS